MKESPANGRKVCLLQEYDLRYRLTWYEKGHNEKDDFLGYCYVYKSKELFELMGIPPHKPNPRYPVRPEHIAALEAMVGAVKIDLNQFDWFLEAYAFTAGIVCREYDEKRYGEEKFHDYSYHHADATVVFDDKSASFYLAESDDEESKIDFCSEYLGVANLDKGESNG